MIETGDHARLDKWLKEQRRGWSLAHVIESHGTLVLLAVLTVAIGVFAAARWGIPLASERVARQLPPTVHAQLGTGALSELDEFLFKPSQLPAARRAMIEAQFDRFAPADDLMLYRVVFRDGGLIGANAFALPDGTIVVTDQLVELALNNDEVLAVLFHEMGHVYHRHSMRKLLSHSALALIAFLIIGDVSSVGDLVLALPGLLTESAYSRAFETEADAYALARMKAQNFDPQHFANLMLRLEACAHLPPKEAETAENSASVCEVEEIASRDDDSWLHYLASHPATAQRIEAFRRTP